MRIPKNLPLKEVTPSAQPEPHFNALEHGITARGLMANQVLVSTADAREDAGELEQLAAALRADLAIECALETPIPCPSAPNSGAARSPSARLL